MIACGRFPAWHVGGGGVQQKGIDGADLAKRWLESTTWIELPFDAYDNAPICTLPHLDGKKKVYELFGWIHGSPKTPLYIESKGYDSVGGKQAKEFWEFLANAYRITAQDFQDGEDARREFWWITRMPFSSTDWASLTTAERIKTALEDHHPEVLGDDSIDIDLLATAAARVEVLPPLSAKWSRRSWLYRTGRQWFSDPSSACPDVREAAHRR